METRKVKYPVGEHDFGELRRGGFVYVDKTRYVYDVNALGKFIFLARPRRFGKSLLLSTFESYFRGEKELFAGTWLGNHEKEWIKYPVLHFDMSETSGKDAEVMNLYLNERLAEYEEDYELPNKAYLNDIGSRFSTLIRGIYRKTGQQVVILIDEYDNGILETLDSSKEEQEAMSNILRAFYKQPKAMTRYVKFCMVTGVARFGSYTLFSGPNNYLDISMMDEYASICGITQRELVDNFEEGILKIANKREETREEAIEDLRQKYDSYRFTESLDLVYNPFSLLCAFIEGRLDNFWIKSGTGKVFIKYLTRSEFDLLELEKLKVTRERMESKYSKTDTIPLLFQTGYLTIKEVEDSKLYRLGIPNGEVRSALVNQLMPTFMGISEDYFPELLAKLQRKVKDGDVKGWIEELQSLISKIPHQLFGPTDSQLKDEKEKEKAKSQSIARFERTYHLIVHMAFQMLAVDARSEISIAGGRIDMVVSTNKYVYVMEFKLDGTTAEALNQIDEKGYLLPWQADGRIVYKIGIVFSSKDRNISSYEYRK
ncbi:MAG: ATP-binding protein [Bacteroidales bacterium]|nr:ATP-binding protein [Bacteroidales bacterium]